MPPVRTANERKKPTNPGHTIAVGSEVYALLLHEKHALEVERRSLVAFGDVIAGLIDARNRLRVIEDRIAAKKAARLAAEAAEGENE